MCDNLCNNLSNGISRRSFLGGTVLGSTAVLSGELFLNTVSASGKAVPVTTSDWDQQPPVKIYVVYLGTGGAWPKPEFDSPAEIRQVFAPRLEAISKKFGDVEFVGGDLIKNNPTATNEILPKIAEQKADAILIVHLAFGGSAPFAILESTGLPVAIYSQPFSGHDWMYVPAMQRAGKRIVMSPSHNIDEVERLVGILRVPVRMKNSKLVMVGNPGCAAGTQASRDYAKVKEKFGTEVIQVTPQEFIETHQSISDADAIAEADEQWIKQAREIREPNREEIIKSCKTYFAMRKLMKDHRAIALAMKCLGGIPIDVLGYPCLGFSKILDDGAVGACEADMDSTLTMMMFLYATGLPGFITDPLMELSKNAVIHAHCVSPTKMDGPQSERLPFTIRTHRDDNAGASVKVLMARDIGREVTWAKLANNDTMLVSTGIIRGDYEFDDRGCRTQIITEVTSSTASELFDKWGANVLGNNMMTLLHRVLFYGDHLRSFKDLSQLMGLKFMIEGKDMAGV
jgi:ornithine carbamoyltransferase